ncbi:hypothetical protein PoB_004713100 [Plakobranchus ocellatus]|uniref:Peptidase A2 domain-containing protein n=1 Tax=Plakobranchus ocellatus TaxID=259542 RepID=A0AAV4BNN2_9GAST|nr:hypothetical protein PoB_004713100 [Plakobranchus ocellatus]
MDDKLSNFAPRIEGKVSSLSFRVEKMEDRIDKLEESHPPYQPQRVVNPNGLHRSRQLQKVVNPKGLDPPGQLNLKEKSDQVVSEGITGMQHQEIALGGEQSIICTGAPNVQDLEAVPAYTVRAVVGNLTVDTIVDTAAEVTVISEEVHRRLMPKPRLSGKRRVQMAGKVQAS